MNFTQFKNDNISGAAELVQQAADLLLSASQNATIESLTEFCKKITNAHPRMAPLINLTQTVLKNCRQADTLPLTPIVQKSVIHFLLHIEESKKRIFSDCYQIIQPHARIATYSRSSIVLETLLHIAETVPFEILLTESRPVNEGRIAAKELTNAGIPVTLFTDAAMNALVRQADLILIGTDAVTPQHIINKIGTLPLALCAQNFNTPIYVLATSDKFIDDVSQLSPELSQPAEEVWKDPPDKVTVYNHYFEEVEREWITGIFS